MILGNIIGGLILMAAIPFVIVLILRFLRNHWPIGILFSSIGTFIGIWLFTDVWWIGLICACFLFGTFNPEERTFILKYDSDGDLIDVEEEKWGPEYTAIAIILLIVTITKAITS